MMNEYVCEKCNKEAVIKDYMFNSNTGSFSLCLNCGWQKTQEYIEDEEVLENYQETYKEQYERMIKEKQIEGQK